MAADLKHYVRVELLQFFDETGTFLQGGKTVRRYLVTSAAEVDDQNIESIDQVFGRERIGQIVQRHVIAAFGLVELARVERAAVFAGLYLYGRAARGEGLGGFACLGRYL